MIIPKKLRSKYLRRAFLKEFNYVTLLNTEIIGLQGNTNL